jgi:BirA family biotin operon repressor/biotin-[acetyl-CoA-carboxylase] ligase
VSGRLFSSGAEAASWAAGLPEWTPGHRHFEYATSTGSTQDMAFAAAARGAPNGSLFLAEEQTAGRGRRGAAWFAPAGGSLLFSVLLTGDASRGGGRIPLGAALAVCRAVEGFAAGKPAIKWPNDLMLGEGKFGGLLTEVRGEVAVLGVGVNVSGEPGDFPPELAESAVCLARACPGVPGRLPLLEAILAQLPRTLGPERESWEDLMAEVAGRLAWRGREVRVGALRGTVAGISSEGHLLLSGRDGETLTAVSGSPELVEP